MVSISVHVSKGVGVGAEVAPPRQRRTDEALDLFRRALDGDHAPESPFPETQLAD